MRIAIHPGATTQSAASTTRCAPLAILPISAILSAAGHIGAPRQRPAAVDDGPVLDHQVVGSGFLHRKTVRSSFCDPRTGRPVALNRGAAGRWESTVARRFTEQP